MSTTIRRILYVVTISAMGSVLANAEGAKKSEIKGGIEGKIVKVDVDQAMLTIANESGRQQAFSITDDTIIIGPRGGLVKKRLKDPRFHQGLPITVVASGKAAAELHLGYDRKATAAKLGDGTLPRIAKGTETTSPRVTRKSAFRGAVGTKSAAGQDAAKSDEEEDDDLEFPGKVRSVDATKHMLVITLLNGKDRSFLIANDAKVTFGRRASKQGLSDAAIKPGLSLTVVTEPGGRKVKEVKVKSVLGRRQKKAA